MILCKICNTRRPRRYCPGVEGDICSICCGTEREVTVNCPLNCEYLREARMHERTSALPDEIPNKDIRVSDEFLSRHKGSLMILSLALANELRDNDSLIDYDVREGLEALIRTYRALDSGLLDETKPNNPLARIVYEKLQQTAIDYQKRVEAAGAGLVRDMEILSLLVFLQRMELHHNNGRRKGRAFISFLHDSFAVGKEEPAVQL